MGNPDIVKLYATAIWPYFLGNFDRAIKGTNNGQKWHTYSAHDDNIASAMAALGLSSWECHFE